MWLWRSVLGRHKSCCEWYVQGLVNLPVPLVCLQHINNPSASSGLRISELEFFFSFLSENFPEFITLDHTRQMKRQVLAGNLLRFQQISDIKLSKPHCRHNSVRGVTQWLYGFLRKSVKLYAWGLTFPPFMKQSCTPSSNGGWLFSSLHTALILHRLKHKLIYLLMT